MTCKTKPRMTAAQRKAHHLRVTAGSTFYVAALVTVSANMYASQHTPVGLIIGVWTPLAFFLSLELMERMPRKGASAKIRMICIGILALIAGWESYWHLVHVLTEGGAGQVGRYAMPLTVDILMVISRMAMNQRAASTTPSVRRTAAKAATTTRKLKAV
jgi:hypothetical protein